MITFLNPYGDPVKIFHFPGHRNSVRQGILDSFEGYKITLPDSIQLITTVENSSIETAPLIKQLNRNHTEFINSAYNKDTAQWCNRKKIQFIYDALCEVDKEYCLILDGLDVGIVGDLSDILDIYKTYDVKVLYNATVAEFPQVKIEAIPDQDTMGTFCYFNAGCCIGETETLKTIYGRALEIIAAADLENDKYATGEQYWMRQVFAEHLTDGLMGIDYKCKIFQIWHKIKKELPTILPTGKITQKLTIEDDSSK